MYVSISTFSRKQKGLEPTGFQQTLSFTCDMIRQGQAWVGYRWLNLSLNISLQSESILSKWHLELQTLINSIRLESAMCMVSRQSIMTNQNTQTVQQNQPNLNHSTKTSDTTTSYTTTTNLPVSLQSLYPCNPCIPGAGWCWLDTGWLSDIQALHVKLHNLY